MKHLLLLLIACAPAFGATPYWLDGNIRAPATNARTPISITLTNYILTGFNQLNIPTYEGSGACLHPSIIYITNGWNGYPYWMAYTPYPGQNPAFENPSLACSLDGQNWITPPGSTNPVCPKPEEGFNSDAEIMIDRTGKMWMLWKYSSSGTCAKFTTDAIHWRTNSDDPTIVANTEPHMLCPVIVDTGTNFMLWSVNQEDTRVYPGNVELRVADAVDGSWSAPVNCVFSGGNLGETEFYWHFDVLRDTNQFAMLMDMSEGDIGSRVAFSPDGTNWTMSSAVLMSGLRGVILGKNSYRSTLCNTPNGYEIYTSFLAASPFIAYKRLDRGLILRVLGDGKDYAGNSQITYKNVGRGKFLSFDGDTLPSGSIGLTDTYVVAPCTIGCWAYIRSASPGSIGKIVDNKDNFTFGITSAKGLRLSADGSTILTSPADVYKFNSWVYVTATADYSGNGGLYTNGILCASGPVGYSTNITYAFSTIGSRANLVATAGLNAIIDCLEVWDYPRSASEILQDYNARAYMHGAGF